MRREFYDAMFDELYTSYLRVSQVMSALALMAVIIAVAGLFGMATLLAGRRRREIGVRKSLGAGTLQMVRMMLVSFAKPVAIANVIAWPAAYFAARRYLDFFIEPIPLTPLPFLLALAATVAVACAAVVGQTVSAARTRPAEVLRHE
ncbi:MAG TPA: FtsX-like permease family protein [Gammaproteobacteria bacterium]